MKSLVRLALISPLLFLSGCSWVEYFTVGNMSNNSIFISYQLKPLSENKTFGIFDSSPDFYKVKPKGGIDWDSKFTIEDTNERADVVSISLPPKTVMIFGRLNNHNYESVDQYFINGREFNLDFMEIEVNLEVHHISKETFDKHFTKKNGFVRYDIL